MNYQDDITGYIAYGIKMQYAGLINDYVNRINNDAKQINQLKNELLRLNEQKNKIAERLGAASAVASEEAISASLLFSYIDSIFDILKKHEKNIRKARLSGDEESFNFLANKRFDELLNPSINPEFNEILMMKTKRKIDVIAKRGLGEKLLQNNKLKDKLNFDMVLAFDISRAKHDDVLAFYKKSRGFVVSVSGRDLPKSKLTYPARNFSLTNAEKHVKYIAHRSCKRICDHDDCSNNVLKDVGVS